MKLTTMTQVTVDGVMQENGGATDEDLLASTTLTEPQRTNTTHLSGDLAAAIGELKAKAGR
jgi:hypothetical protein